MNLQPGAACTVTIEGRPTHEAVFVGLVGVGDVHMLAFEMTHDGDPVVHFVNPAFIVSITPESDPRL